MDDPASRVTPPPAVLELQRRIGRNLLVYQHIELMLKALLATTGIEGPWSELRAKAQARAKVVGGMSLGALIGLYLEEVMTLEEKPSKEPESINEPWFRSRLQFRPRDPADFDRDRATLRALVDRRNTLAHNFLERYDTNDTGEVEVALRQLEVDGEGARAVQGHLRELLQHVEKMQQGAGERLRSSVFRDELKLGLLQLSPISQTLQALCAQPSREDGWTDLASAGRQLHAQLPDDMRNMKSRYGYDGLRSFVMASKLFDVRDEPLGGSSVRTLIRLADVK
jgi:hypothetical protein